MHMQNTSLSPGMLLRQRYHILEPLGEGGFGTVYKACDEGQSGRLVAIKQLNMPKSLSVQEKIEITDSYNREVMLLSALRHKCLPRIYDHFTEPEHWYVVMEYLEGGTLDQQLHGQRLPLNEVLTIGIKLCSVLDYLHQRKPPIIFRDVKPDNILLTPQGNIYLIDFGIARRYRTQQAKDTGALGSPGYAAPEQYGREQTTPQTDIYGLGATLQTLLTSKDPLEIKTDGWPPDVLIPQKLQALLERMMEHEINKRPPGMRSVRWHLSEMRQGIEQHGLPPQIPPLALPPQISPRPRAQPNAPIFWPDIPALPAQNISSSFWDGFLNILDALDSYSFEEIWRGAGKLIFLLLLFPSMGLYFAWVVTIYQILDWLGIIFLLCVFCLFCWIISAILVCILALCLKLFLRPFQTQLQNRQIRRISQIRLRQQAPPHQY